MPFGLKMSQDVFRMQMDQETDHLPGIIVIHDHVCCLWLYPQGPWLTPPSSDADSQTTLHSFQQLKLSDQATSNCLLQCCIHCTGHAARSLQNPSPPGPSHSRLYFSPSHA